MAKVWFYFLILSASAGLFPCSGAHGGTLVFSKPARLATIPWADAAHPGAPASGAEWLVADGQERFYLVAGLDFELFDGAGRHLRTLSPIDRSKNFYGFEAMEALPSGLVLLQRLESPLEQWGKDNFEMQTKPGVRLEVVSTDGQVGPVREVVDPTQPHSHYYLEEGDVYGIHDDGSFNLLDSAGSRSTRDGFMGSFAAVAFNVEKWRAHLRSLPVFRTADRTYHDVKGGLHVDKGALAFLMGRPFIESTGMVAERSGKIYYQVVCERERNFVNAVFVEDGQRKNYGLVELVPPDGDLTVPHDHALYVDSSGNLYEGVAVKEGYRIYRWKLIR